MANIDLDPGKNKQPTSQEPKSGCCTADQHDVQQQLAELPPARLEPPTLPSVGLSTEFCHALERGMHRATWLGVHATKRALPPELLQAIVLGVTPILSKEPTMLEIRPGLLNKQRVTVIGDTHGQYHDVCKLFQLYGHPSLERIYIFNGDYVDRGAWGVETLTLLLAWKWLVPNNVYLIRGNHETNMITRIYGFYAEMKAKYGAAAKGLFTHIRRMFAHLPLAALVEGNTLILHGGLFRAPPGQRKGNKRRRSGTSLTLGTLDDLRQASKGGQDPDPERSIKNTIASDVVWSDPVNTPGLLPNEARGCGTVFGPDATESFLSSNGVKLIIRSHEGPDARDKRVEENKLPSVENGYAVDHLTASGRLVTLFSAPDYPQFIAEGEPRYNNRAAVLHLTAPDYTTPQVESFEADLPRPEAQSYYDVPGFTDDEEELEQQDADEPNAAAQGTVPAANAAAARPTLEAAAAATVGEVVLEPAAAIAQAATVDAPAAATAHDVAAATASEVWQQAAEGHSAPKQLLPQSLARPAEHATPTAGAAATGRASSQACSDHNTKVQHQKENAAKSWATNTSGVATPPDQQPPENASTTSGIPLPLSPLQQQDFSSSTARPEADAEFVTQSDAAAQQSVSGLRGCSVDEPPTKRLRAGTGADHVAAG